MKTVQTILFPTDFSETAQNAFRYCLRVADAYQAKIELLHVIYPEYETMDIPVMAMKATQDKSEAAKEALQSFVDLSLVQVQAAYELRRAPSINSKVEIGDPVSVIAKIARRDHADLIIMGTKGRHNVLEKVFGSVTTGVMARAHCSVWVIPEEATYNAIDIVAYATDLQETDPYHIWKVSQLLEVFNPIMHCVHVQLPGAENGQLNISELEMFFTTHAPTLQIQFHNLKGASVYERLEEFVDTYDVNVLAMYAPHQNLLERIFYQSTTRKMALRTHIPLLMYRTV
jgi:nucleotide-binding universal stress UspA family protein